jgi:hypothetical protein
MSQDIDQAIDLILEFIIEERDAATNRIEKDAASIKKLREYWTRLQEIKMERIRREVPR